MAASEFSSEVKIPINAPTTDHLRVLKKGVEINTVDTLTLKHKKTGEAIWRIQKSGRHLQFTFDLSYFAQLKDSISKVKRNEGDFAICDSEESDDSILYFWWHA